ncbi:hypothetical protein PG993_003362 [Apiospora rasikravindrae]|uniref:Major facilitator superfamily (MFS) profile domain-containing protein n=1 Tax=Apiospora rasikravindrae TaxID=990691 RepID=A0ABR1TZD0_9PEZI
MTTPQARGSDNPRLSKGSLLPVETLAPPFPRRQMLVLAICRICEPIAFMGIFPYVYYMVKDFHITEDHNKISFYAGLVTSAFTFAEFSTGFLWGRLSDRVGRKPVLLTGLIGTALSVLIFGFAQNLWVALAARAIGGLLNGNMGVLQSTVTELVTAKEHRPRAFTMMPIVWCIGSIIGPMIGGALAKPCETYPNLFAEGSIWDAYPYLLPNLFSAFVVLVGVITGFLFLEETHYEKKRQQDHGVELGNWLIAKASKVCSWRTDAEQDSKFATASEYQPLLAPEEQLPGYRTTENSPANSPRINTVRPVVEQPETLNLDEVTANATNSKKFTRPVLLNVAAFGILAFHTMTFDSLLPTFLATEAPNPPKPMVLPFKFVGGFGFSTAETGVLMSGQGIYSMLINAFLVPFAIGRLGHLRVFQLVAVAYFALYLVTPYLVLLPDNLRMVGICFIIVWKSTFSSLAYPSNAMLTADAAPSQKALGTINGVAASTASLCRALAPAVSGMLYAFGLDTGYSGLAWWFSALVTIAGAFLALRIPTQKTYDEKAQGDLEAATSSE